jgi:hypothetical protein
MLTVADTRKFTLAVSQTYEAIEASANWVNRDQKDVEQVSFSDRDKGSVVADYPVHYVDNNATRRREVGHIGD